MERYLSFDRLTFDRPSPRVLRITLNRPEKRNALDHEMHRQITAVWSHVDADPETSVSIITGAGSAFCAGGDISMIENIADEDAGVLFHRVFGEATGLVSALIEARKPIISAINGPAIGAGLALALLSDIPIASTTARLIDGHTKVGIAAGDHAALIWPLLCGMAKAKYFLMTNREISGSDAERMNLVALAVPPEELQAAALKVACELVGTAPSALAMTKYALNHWLRQARPIFDLSVAMEIAGMKSADAKEAQTAMRERRPPMFRS